MDSRVGRVETVWSGRRRGEVDDDALDLGEGEEMIDSRWRRRLNGQVSARSTKRGRWGEREETHLRLLPLAEQLFSLLGRRDGDGFVEARSCSFEEIQRGTSESSEASLI